MENIKPPGCYIKEGYLDPLNITIAEAARKLKISKAYLSGIVNGRLRITPILAKKFEYANMGKARNWLTLQREYDLKYTPVQFDVEKILEEEG